MTTIEITISPTGESKLQTKGFFGDSCQSASRGLENALGLRKSETLTSDYFQQLHEIPNHLRQEE